MALLSRDEFREGVFKRDGHKCVICKQEAQDAHHIIERRLWPDGGYYLDNGASLCGQHHIEAEQTVLGADRIRVSAGITTCLLPPHLYRDQEYDKWGNPIMGNGTRLKGDLFFDESVQKVLRDGGVLSLFISHVKFPRTYHLPWSPGLTKDDRQMDNVERFIGQEVVATLKMDGENTTMYRDYVHARSLTFEPHPSRNWIKVIHSKIAHEIPEGWRICGENLTAVHSIEYKDLPGYFMMFSIWNEKNVCLPWDEMLEWAQLLELPTVHDFWRGTYKKGSDHHIQEAFSNNYQATHEGYVVRLASSFPYSEYRKSVGKWVRKNHVQTHGHWMREVMRLNGLMSETSSQ